MIFGGPDMVDINDWEDIVEPEDESVSPFCCSVCGGEAPHGESRIVWLRWHHSVLHRFCWVVTRRVRPHLKYASYVARHKWFVLMAGRKTKAPLWRLLIHDWSKLTFAEWFPYVREFYGPKGIVVGYNFHAFDAAWLHHQHRNPHHWQHWLLREDGGATKALPMPEGLVREMVADWMGAGRAITGRWDVAGWYQANAHKIVLHRETRDHVRWLIGQVSEPEATT